ncbi:MAG: hypothetical protein JWM11_1996 [Planctomycetaceae bacterium]|nr:hypothetical protein [Planctomycetaceae bacterium]
MTRSHLLSILVFCALGETKLASEEPAPFETIEAVEHVVPDSFNDSSDDTPNSSIQRSPVPKIEDGYKSWLRRGGYPATDSQDEHYLAKLVSGRQRFPGETCVIGNVDVLSESYVTDGGETVTVEYGMSVSQIIDLLQPLPRDRDRLVNLENALKYDYLGQTFRGIARPVVQNGGDIVIASKHFPRQLFCLRFEAGSNPQLIRVAMAQQDRYTMWLSYWCGADVAEGTRLWPQCIPGSEYPNPPCFRVIYWSDYVGSFRNSLSERYGR